jgi:hypothetical protein
MLCNNILKKKIFRKKNLLFFTNIMIKFGGFLAFTFFYKNNLKRSKWKVFQRFNLLMSRRCHLNWRYSVEQYFYYIPILIFLKPRIYIWIRFLMVNFGLVDWPNKNFILYNWNNIRYRTQTFTFIVVKPNGPFWFGHEHMFPCLNNSIYKITFLFSNLKPPWIKIFPPAM